jgi:hypothetical protein
MYKYVSVYNITTCLRKSKLLTLLAECEKKIYEKVIKEIGDQNEFCVRIEQLIKIGLFTYLSVWSVTVKECEKINLNEIDKPSTENTLGLYKQELIQHLASITDEEFEEKLIEAGLK